MKPKPRKIHQVIFPVIIGFLLLTCGFSGAQVREIKFKETFENLDDWGPLYFPKIKKHTIYTAESKGGIHYLKAESDASASALLYKKEFNIYKYPRLRWSWKVDNIYQKGDARSKEGDDYPLRIYVVFEYDPEKASTWERLEYGAAKAIYGEYPPHSSLNYIWSSKWYPENILPNPYTEKAMMILLQKGAENVGKWIEQEVDILEDYRRAFNEDPPSKAGLAIMNDSDNTGEKSTSYVQFIEVFRNKNKP